MRMHKPALPTGSEFAGAYQSTRRPNHRLKIRIIPAENRPVRFPTKTSSFSGKPAHNKGFYAGLYVLPVGWPQVKKACCTSFSVTGTTRLRPLSDQDREGGHSRCLSLKSQYERTINNHILWVFKTFVENAHYEKTMQGFQNCLCQNTSSFNSIFP